jgi:hypothetical protein
MPYEFYCPALMSVFGYSKIKFRKDPAPEEETNLKKNKNLGCHTQNYCQNNLNGCDIIVN